MNEMKELLLKRFNKHFSEIRTCKYEFQIDEHYERGAEDLLLLVVGDLIPHETYVSLLHDLSDASTKRHVYFNESRYLK